MDSSLGVVSGTVVTANLAVVSVSKEMTDTAKVIAEVRRVAILLSVELAACLAEVVGAVPGVVSGWKASNFLLSPSPQE